MERSRMTQMTRKALCLLLLTMAVLPIATHGAVESYAQTFGSGGQKQEVVRRERNVDHWDSDTLAYFLDTHPGYDAAVLFYAPWDENSRLLGKMWGQIAGLLNAGTSDSGIVLSVFDCERDHSHVTLCQQLSVAYYPTIMFIGSGTYHDTDPISRFVFGKSKSAGPMGDAPVPNTVKFQGNWNYGDPILDWIRTMQGLSTWHQWSTKGAGRRLRNLFSRKQKENPALPVGVPPGGASQVTTTMSGKDSAELKNMRNELDTANAKKEALEGTVLRASVILDTMLNTKEPLVDVFAILHENDGWKELVDKRNDVLRFCVLETAMDYCKRITNQVANDLVEELEGQDPEVLKGLDIEALEADILQRIQDREAYCKVLEDCVAADMQPAEQCQPQTNPFQNPVAWRYMEACLDSDVQKQYAEALGIDPSDIAGPAAEAADAEAADAEAPTATEAEAEAASSEAGTAKKGWGM